jgi:hypothetical protein
MLAFLCAPAFAWGPEGHQVIGSIGDQLLSDHAKQIAARARKVGDQSELDGVVGHPEDDRDRRCRSLGRQRSDLKAGYDNDCYGLMDQVGYNRACAERSLSQSAKLAFPIRQRRRPIARAARPDVERGRRLLRSPQRQEK